MADQQRRGRRWEDLELSVGSEEEAEMDNAGRHGTFAEALARAAAGAQWCSSARLLNDLPAVAGKGRGGVLGEVPAAGVAGVALAPARVTPIALRRGVLVGWAEWRELRTLPVPTNVTNS
jgi:hypothetical protein